MYIVLFTAFIDPAGLLTRWFGGVSLLVVVKIGLQTNLWTPFQEVLGKSSEVTCRGRVPGLMFPYSTSIASRSVVKLQLSPTHKQTFSQLSLLSLKCLGVVPCQELSVLLFKTCEHKNAILPSHQSQTVKEQHKDSKTLIQPALVVAEELCGVW